MTPLRALWARGCSGDMPSGRKVTAARRQASRLAGLAGGDPLHLTPRHRARGCSGDMQLGQGFTAVARQVPRLAGLVRLPAGWQVHTAIRRQASWLATKASVKSKSRWPFALQKIQATSKHPNPQGVNLPTADCGKRKSASLSAPQNFPATPKHPNPQGGKYAHRQLRRSRAAIGSGGKKARPF